MSTNVQLPQRLALLPTTLATAHLTLGVLTGREQPARVALTRGCAALPDASCRWDTAPVREILDEAMRRFDTHPPQADAWLAPRLHATVRMTRSEAADPRLWAFLAMVVAPDYVIWRHRSTGRRGDGAAQPTRFVGRKDLHAFARLWWAAELFRDGEDYSPAEIVCEVQDVLHGMMRLDVITHRPTALALARIIKELRDAGVSRLGDRTNALSTAVNAAGSTLLYDVIAPDDLPDQEGLLAWIAAADLAPAVPWDRLPDGPDDGCTPRDSVDTLVRLFEEFRDHAPLRERRASSDRPAADAW
ncbi:DUF6339 family protein [Streptomyces sp. NPDC057072]|uniref:DUF6339 family protein n=1 Tax=Streptomyces sp. NPDC057072 TaxID=3346014 RepID=UPI0036380672